MKWFYKLLLISSVVCIYIPIYAQTQRQLDGTVYQKNVKGKTESLPGAYITVLKSSIGTESDTNGYFALSVPDTTNNIVVSYMGFKPDTVVLKPGENTLKIVLDAPRSLKEVVISERQKSTEIGLLSTTKIEKIGHNEIFKAACCNLSESFETTPSVDVAFTDAVTGYKQIMLLGLAGPYTLITRENIPDVRGLAAITGLTYTPGSWIESMQLSKGTGSVVNGYESVAGQINVELEKPNKGDTWLFNLYQNSQGRTEGNINLRAKVNTRLRTNLFLNASSHWMRTDENKDGFIDEPLGNRFVGMNRWFYSAPNDWEFQAGVKTVFVNNIGGQWDYDKGGEQIPGKPWGYQLNTKRVEEWAKIGKVYDDKPGTSFGLQLSSVYHDQDARYGLRDYTATQRSLYANFIFQSLIHNTNNIIKVGLSSVMDQYEERFDKQQYNRTETVPGAFVEYAYTYSTKFSLVAGLRGDYDNIYGGFMTPRLHLRFAPFSKTAIRASIGRAQRTANIFAENMGAMASNRQFVVMGEPGGKAYGLDPEVAWNSGLNLTQKFKLDYREGSFTADYYYTNFQSQVIADIEDANFVKFYNLQGKSFAHSLQFQLDYELAHKLDLRLAYRWYDVEMTYGTMQKERPLIAANRAFMNLGYETKNHWKFDYTLQWVGTKRVPASYDIPEGNSPEFIQMSAQVTKVFSDKLDVYLGGENLTNYMQENPIIGASNPYGNGFDASLISGPVMGRSIYMGVRYKVK